MRYTVPKQCCASDWLWFMASSTLIHYIKDLHSTYASEQTQEVSRRLATFYGTLRCIGVIRYRVTECVWRHRTELNKGRVFTYHVSQGHRQLKEESRQKYPPR